MVFSYCTLQSIKRELLRAIFSQQTILDIYQHFFPNQKIRILRNPHLDTYQHPPLCRKQYRFMYKKNGKPQINKIQSERISVKQGKTSEKVLTNKPFEMLILQKGWKISFRFIASLLVKAYIIRNMLGAQLSKMKQLDLSRSSILHEDMDQRTFKDMLDEKDRTIRRLSNKIEKIEEQLRRAQSDKNSKNSKNEAAGLQNMHLKLLKVEIAKTKRLEEIVAEITQRVNGVLDELCDNEISAQSREEIKQMVLVLENSKNQSFNAGNQSNLFQASLNISDEWIKKIDVFQGAFKCYKLQYKSMLTQNKSLTSQNDTLKRKVSQLEAQISGNEEVIQLNIQLKQQKKQKQKIKQLLQITQLSKNELINKINSVTLSKDIKAITKEELLQYSKELHYRIKDLQGEKASILKQSTKEKQDELKKYQEFLGRLRTLKEKSLIAKSCA